MKSNKGITLILLIIVIIIMLLLLGIVTSVSRDILEKSKGEKLLTYMKLIETRADAYYEEIDFEIGEKDFESYIVLEKEDSVAKFDENLASIVNLEIDKLLEKEGEICYIKWNANKLANQGIDNTFLEDEEEVFIIAYNYKIHEVENVYYNKGIYFDGNKDLEGNKRLIYSLSELEQEMSK